MSIIRTSATMSLEHFHDFYYVQAIKTAISSGISLNPELEFSGAVNKLREDVLFFEEDVYPNMAFRTFVYLYAACLGEARHARHDMAKKFFVPNFVSLNRESIFSEITQYRPTQANLDILTAVFSQDWRGSFGGKAWLDIVKACKEYFTLPASTFIDHVVDLEHNNGTAFSKEDARDTIFFETRYRRGYFRDFLDYKFEKDILKDWTKDIRVTGRVYGLLRRYNTLFHNTTSWVSAGLEKLDDYNVSWGEGKLALEKKWMSWVSVSKEHGNKPSARILTSDLTNMYIHDATEKKLKKHVATVKKQALANGARYLTPKLKSEILTKCAIYYTMNVKYCVMEKQKVTYQILPCKARKVSPGVVAICVPVPYTGIGKQTSYGFTFMAKSVIYCGSKENGYTVDGRKYEDGYLFLQSKKIIIRLGNRNYYIAFPELEAILE